MYSQYRNEPYKIEIGGKKAKIIKLVRKMSRQEVLQSMCLINRSADPSVSLGDLRDTELKEHVLFC